MILVLGAIAVLVAGSLAALAAGEHPRLATRIGVVAAVLAALIGLVPAIGVLLGGPELAMGFRAAAPLGEFVLQLDALSAFFLVPVLGLGALGAVYAHGYLRPYGWKNLGVATAALLMLLAGMTGVLVARAAVPFLLSWEVMSLAAWLLVGFEHERDEVRRAGWVYLVATHLGTVFLLGLLLLLRARGGVYSFDAADIGELGPLILALSLVGFGAKAGLFPFHVWLPEAHSAAPSHVSALMSGVLVKIGVYGILRILLLVGSNAWIGPLLMTLGLVGALLGVTLAMQQRDLKRVLAYSTVENVGIVVLAVGIGASGLDWDDPTLAALGFAGALFHVWNHALMKSLMFLAAGSVLHGARSKDLERLGGLMKRMPSTGLAMVIGGVAIAGLPPLNGFASEWLVYMGLVAGGQGHAGTMGLGWMLAMGLLALVGGLAAACFVRLVGIVMLGARRDAHAEPAHEADTLMLLPMGVLALGCVALGVFPALALILARPAIEELAGGPVPLPDLTGPSLVAALVWLACGILAAVLAMRLRAQPVAEGATWDCGYAAPSATMQYTGAAFSQIVRSGAGGREIREASRFRLEYGDPLLERVYLRGLDALSRRLVALRVMQTGSAHLYVGYIAVIVVVAMVWATLRSWGER